MITMYDNEGNELFVCEQWCKLLKQSLVTVAYITEEIHGRERTITVNKFTHQPVEWVVGTGMHNMFKIVCSSLEIKAVCEWYNLPCERYCVNNRKHRKVTRRETYSKGVYVYD